MTKYERSPWVDQFPKSRAPAYPRHRGLLDTDIAIVGGGLTGCATAYALAAAGIKAVLVEGNQIGHGSTGAAAGRIAEEPGVRFGDLENARILLPWRTAFLTSLSFALAFYALLRVAIGECYTEAEAAIT